MNTNTNWAIRHAIFDMVETNLLEVPNKKQMLNFIKDDISKEDLFELYNMMKNEDNQSCEFLKECYYNNLKQNSKLSIFNESIILKQRDNVLMEAEEEKIPITIKDIGLLLKRYGPIGVGLHLANVWFTGTKEQRIQMKRVVAQAGKKYDQQINATFLRRILPQSKTFKKVLTNPITGPRDIAKDTLKKIGKEKTNLFSKHPGIKRSGKYVRIGISIAAALAGAYHAYKYYMDNKKVWEVCKRFKGKQNTICILKFKIAALATAIAISAIILICLLFIINFPFLN